MSKYTIHSSYGCFKYHQWDIINASLVLGYPI